MSRQRLPPALAAAGSVRSVVASVQSGAGGSAPATPTLARSLLPVARRSGLAASGSGATEMTSRLLAQRAACVAASGQTATAGSAVSGGEEKTRLQVGCHNK